MSAPPLNKAAPISAGASFYNPVEAVSQPVETTQETAEGISPPHNDTQTPTGSMPLEWGFGIAADLDSIHPSYIGEDGRLALLRGKVYGSATLNPADSREIHTMFRRMAADSSGSGASISQQILGFLPLISQTLIQFIGQLESNSKLQISYALLQATQENQEAGGRQTGACATSLQKEIESLKDDMRKLKTKNDSLERVIRRVERLRANPKAQKGSLQAENERPGLGATSDSDIEGSNKKRRRDE